MLVGVDIFIFVNFVCFRIQLNFLKHHNQHKSIMADQKIEEKPKQVVEDSSSEESEEVSNGTCGECPIRFSRAK